MNIIIVDVYNYLENNVKQGIQHQEPEISNLTNKITMKESDKFRKFQVLQFDVKITLWRRDCFKEE